jgi:hypothetical protein
MWKHRKYRIHFTFLEGNKAGLEGAGGAFCGSENKIE